MGIGLAALLVFSVVMRRVTQAGSRRVEATDATRPSEEEPPVQSPEPEPVRVSLLLVSAKSIGAASSNALRSFQIWLELRRLPQILLEA